MSDSSFVIKHLQQTSNGLKWIESNYDDLLRARFLNKRERKR